MVLRDDLIYELNQLFDPAAFREDLANGLQVEGAAEIRVLATACTASLAAIDTAIAAGARALLVHHGLFWGQDPRIRGLLKPRIARLLAADCSLIAYHLPLDAHPVHGNAAIALSELGASDQGAFGTYKGVMVGRQGLLAEAATAEALRARLAVIFDHPVQHCPGGPAAIRRIGVVTGGGYGCLVEAAGARLDALISGECSEQTWHEAAELGIHCFACGHSATEDLAVHRIGADLAARRGLRQITIRADNPC